MMKVKKILQTANRNPRLTPELFIIRVMLPSMAGYMKRTKRIVPYLI